MQTYLLSLAGPLLQTSDVPNTVKPWQENWVIDAVAIAFALLFILLIWLWARSGRTKRENKVPFERTAEDFAGSIQAAYGVIPPFLVVVYAGVLIAIAGYIILGLVNGVQY